MTKKTSLELLKDEIAMKRGELNSLVEGDVDRQKLLKISMDLDELIYKYYMLEKEFKEDKAAE
ncbi:Spo0E family sporulation regulatory protein-aspartic acid phosphatase [Sporanaerobacter sp.]|uniref:Spo0E family sporulation regulatory protein-aspartic acid phosphatase n=1 Tax=Sporanaerobacter sp. TaxID=2010183 RepID=UPI003A1021B4